MQPGAAPILGRKDRHVRRSVVRLGAQASRHRVAFSLEEALRLVNLPGEDEGRIYHFRRLVVTGVPAEASRAAWIECMQEALATQARYAVHGADPRSNTSDVVYFDNDDEALEAILCAALRPDAKPAWFWPAAVGISAESHAAPNATVILERIREQRAPQHAAAIILAALEHSDPTPMLSSLPAFTARDWLRSLEASGAVLAEARSVPLSKETTSMLQSAAQQFGGHDQRTLWLATQIVLSVAPPSQSSAVSVKRAQATLRTLESTRTHRPAETSHEAPAHRLAEPPAVHRSIVFDADEDVIEPLPEPQASSPLSVATSELVHDDVQPQISPQKTPLPLGERSQFAGLYFLLPVLRQLGIARSLEACPALVEANFVARIIRALATHAGVDSDDSILCVVNTLSAQTPFALPLEAPATPGILPSGFRASLPANADGDFLVRLWAVAVRRWCWRMGAISAREIVTRSGRVWLTRNDLDVTFLLSSADIRIRRLGLDINPGWLPWLGKFGLVVRFHYQDRDTGGDAC